MSFAPTHLVIHGAHTPPSMDVGVEEIRVWHIDRGFSDIGYHYVIRRDGSLEIGRPLDQMGAHAHGMNKHSLGVCLVGGMPAKGLMQHGDANAWDFNYTKAQLSRLVRVRQKHANLEVLGHRDVPDTEKDCPGFDVKLYFGE